MATKQQSQRLDFLLQAGYTMVRQCPSLSRFYINHFQEILQHHELTPSKALDRLSCPRCGQIYLAGDNTSVTVESRPQQGQKQTQQCYLPHATTTDLTGMTSLPKSKQRQQRKNRKNMLVYACHACYYRRNFKGSFKRHIPINTKIIEPEAEQSIGKIDVAVKASVKATTKTTINMEATQIPTTINKTKVVSSTITKNVNLHTSKKRSLPQQQQLQSHKESSSSSSSSKGGITASTSNLPSKKKAKKNQLQALLAKRSEQKQDSSSSPGLSDFLSSL